MHEKELSKSKERKNGNKKAFLREYIKAIRDVNAALFAGAGLSRPSGFVDWKELLRPLAEDIGLNIEGLIFLGQQYLEIMLR